MVLLPKVVSVGITLVYSVAPEVGLDWVVRCLGALLCALAICLAWIFSLMWSFGGSWTFSLEAGCKKQPALLRLLLENLRMILLQIIKLVWIQEKRITSRENSLHFLMCEVADTRREGIAGNHCETVCRLYTTNIFPFVTLLSTSLR